MTEVSPEILVILDTHAAGDALEQMRSVATVTQVLPPRLALVRPGLDTATRLARISGVLAVFVDAAAELPADLTPSEREFASAWALRQRPKTRPGDDLSWDAPGFLPPDRPPHRRS